MEQFVDDDIVPELRIEGTPDHLLQRAGLVLTQDIFVQLLVLLGKEDVLLQEVEHLRDSAGAPVSGLTLFYPVALD